MTKDDVKAVLDRVLTWPPERQEEAVEILTSIEEQDASPYQLTDDQATEVRRRQGERRSPKISLDEAFGRFHSRSRTSCSARQRSMI